MNLLRLGLAAGILLVTMSGSAYAAIGQLEGRWKNVDPETRGLTTLDVTGDGDRVKVHAWGKCDPTDCDWGTVDATAFAPSVDSALPSNARTLIADYKTSFSESILV